VLAVRRMLERIRPAGPTSGARIPASPSRNSTRPATPLRSALRRPTRFASASVSIPMARTAPSFTAAIARMPLPLPRSSASWPGCSSSSSRASAARVEPCSPLPKALSGSRTTVYGSGWPASGTQEGTTVSLPKRRGPRPSRQRVDQSTGSNRRRRVSADGSTSDPSCVTSASALASSGAKVTSVPSSLSSTACPVRATSHAVIRSLCSAAGRTSMAHQLMRAAPP
jgi:hypothetical protein